MHVARVYSLSIRERVVLKVTRLERYHRTTVPEEVRKLLSLKEGNEIAWILEKNKIIIERAKDSEGVKA